MDKINVVFLDFDGVVNTMQWRQDEETGKWKSLFANPDHDAVNDRQAVQWVSEFCEKYNYSIVCSSTWRYSDDYAKYLINAGLRPGIRIIGRTPHIENRIRGFEISQWLKEHPEVENYLIFDDDNDMGDLIDHLVRCESSAGFRFEEYRKAVELHGFFVHGDERKKKIKEFCSQCHYAHPMPWGADCTAPKCPHGVLEILASRSIRFEEE